MISYRNLRSADLQQLDEYVRGSIAMGYEPLGGVVVTERRFLFFFTSHMYIQTMIKKQ